MALFGGKKEASGGASELFDTAMAQVGHDVYMLLRADDLMPVSITGNFQRVFNMPEQRIIDDIEALYRIMSDESRASVKQASRTWDGSSSLECTFSCTPDDTDLVREVRCVVDPIEQGAYYFVSFSDISRERAAERAMMEQLKIAQEEATTKSSFLSNMSHEIRTPLNGILGLLGLAQERTNGDAELSEDLTQASELGKYLLSLVNDILDMSRIESGKVELEHVPFDLVDFARDLKAMFEGQAQAKGVIYTVEIENCEHRYVLGDRLRLSQVIVNLISNAVKFTAAQGSVSVVLKEMYFRDDRVRFMIRVRDTGKGMSPQFLGRIFQPFEQEDSGIAGKFGGSGLGMAIADSLIGLMGGEIVVDSELGKGSEFSVYVSFDIAKDFDPSQLAASPNATAKAFVRPPLPAYLRSSDAPEQGNETVASSGEQTHDAFSGMHALLAEDNEINAKILESNLSKWNVTCARAHDGREAVDMYKAAQPGEYDFILMDIQMPEMNGWEATQAIREYEETTGAHGVIVALSANAYAEDVRHSKEMGMDGHVGKPVDLDELESLLKTLI